MRHYTAQKRRRFCGVFCPIRPHTASKNFWFNSCYAFSTNIVCSKKKAFSISFPRPFIGAYGGIKWSIHTTSPTCFMYQKTALPYSGKRGFIDMRLAKGITH